MKTAKLESEMKKKLAGVGIEITPDSPAARRMTEVAKIGADVVNTGNKALRAAHKAIRNAAESARETIHDATKPPPKRPKK
jgi:2-methylisocitrate lyase-like PEP mutase family enzyme